MKRGKLCESDDENALSKARPTHSVDVGAHDEMVWTRRKQTHANAITRSTTIVIWKDRLLLKNDIADDSNDDEHREQAKEHANAAATAFVAGNEAHVYGIDNPCVCGD